MIGFVVQYLWRVEQGVNVQSRLASDQYTLALGLSLTGVYVFLQENLETFSGEAFILSASSWDLCSWLPRRGEPSSALALEQVGSLACCTSAFLCFLQKSTPWAGAWSWSNRGGDLGSGAWVRSSSHVEEGNWNFLTLTPSPLGKVFKAWIMPANMDSYGVWAIIQYPFKVGNLKIEQIQKDEWNQCLEAQLSLERAQN